MTTMNEIMTTSSTTPFYTKEQSRTQTSTPVMNEELWPKLSATDEESKDLSYGRSAADDNEDDEDWEYVSSNASVKNTNDEEESNFSVLTPTNSETKEGELEDHSLIHRCESTPEFSSFSTLGSIQSSEDDLSYVVDCGSSIDVQSVLTTNDDTILVSKKKTNGIKKVPSFKDMIMMNAEKIKDEEEKKKQELLETQEKRRKNALQQRKANRTRIIVTPIKRCARSTGDLRSLVIHEDEEGINGGSNHGTIHEEEEEVLGCTDAMEYYNRKSHGSKGRANGLKIRPDEAKRKEFIIHKKNAQRRAQGKLY